MAQVITREAVSGIGKKNRSNGSLLAAWAVTNLVHRSQADCNTIALSGLTHTNNLCLQHFASIYIYVFMPTTTRSLLTGFCFTFGGFLSIWRFCHQMHDALHCCYQAHDAQGMIMHSRFVLV